MDFELSEEQEALAESVRSVLEQECPIARVRERVEKGLAPEQPWGSAARLGWCGIGVPEALGGAGLGFVDLALVIEQHGVALAPGPFLPTTTQFAPLVRAAGSPEQRQQLLGAVAAGACRGALAVAGESGACFPPDASLRARPNGAGFVLDGVRHFVIEGDAADEIAVAARVESGDGVGLFAVPQDAVRAHRIQSLDASRSLATLVFEGVSVGPDRILGPPGASAPALSRALDEAAAALALEMVGTCQALFERTLSYARERRQFGHPIGSFQAIQHALADDLAALEKARATGYFAAMAIAEDDPRRSLAASMAKASAGDCQRRLAKDAIQIHGGIGFTWEHDIHLFVKRAKSGEALLGSSDWHRERIASLLLG
jgi:alkylation response protein AidB-like acyl-CoA dehydrogenase